MALKLIERKKGKKKELFLHVLETHFKYHAHYINMNVSHNTQLCSDPSSAVNIALINRDN